MLKRMILAALSLLLVGPASAGQIFPPPNGLWIAPSIYNQTLYGPSQQGGTASRWTATQWGTWDADLPPFAGNGTSSHSITYNTAAEWPAIGISIDRPSSAPCNGLNGGPEMDAFIQPNGGTATYPGYPSAGPGSAPLNTLTSITHTVTIEHGRYVVYDANCPVATQLAINTAFVLSNGAGQTFFWQIVLYDQRVPAWSDWFFTGGGGQWGYSEPITDFGPSYVKPNTTKTFNINLLGRLKAAIRAGSATGLDQNMSHWKITGAYVGFLAWGHVNDFMHVGGWTLTAN